MICGDCGIEVVTGKTHYVPEDCSKFLRAEVARLKKLIWSPHTKDFLEAVKIEAAHQRDRWGDKHDKEKEDQDWFWTLGWLAGKAVRPENPEKRLHHIITSAALLLNWHRFAKEQQEAGPGISK